MLFSSLSLTTRGILDLISIYGKMSSIEIVNAEYLSFIAGTYSLTYVYSTLITSAIVVNCLMHQHTY